MLEELPPNLRPLEKANFQQIILTHLERYPRMQIQDLYKLCYQAAMGNSHLGWDREKALAYLTEEMGRVEANAEEPIVEPISPDRMIVRLNLRPYKARMGRPEALLEAMFQSARAFQPAVETLERYWHWVELTVVKPEFPFRIEALHEYIQPLKAQNFPVKHHSAVYREHYYPAYRVILSEFLPVNAR